MSILAATKRIPEAEQLYETSEAKPLTALLQRAHLYNKSTFGSSALQV
jgi:hypothetical protein